MRCIEQEMLSCLPGHSRCFHLDQLCTYDRDTEGYLKYCRNGAHLRYCSDISCSRKYKCSNSYCIPYRLVCDGIWDCQEGKDEEGCLNMICPGTYRCSHRLICIHISSICDSTEDCPKGDDELLCDIKDCPLKCACLGYSLECKSINDITIDLIYTSAKHLAIHNTKAVEDNFFICNFPSLVFLNISMNGISSILNSFMHSCQLNSDLRHIDLSLNKIKIIIRETWQQLDNLEIISLHSNIIHQIERNAFKNLPHLLFLDISNNDIIYLNSFMFDTIQSSLKFLDIKFNPLFDIDIGIASRLEGIKISTNDFKLCCILLQKISDCGKYSPYLSSCSHFLESNTYRFFVWLISIVGISLNLVSILIQLTPPKSAYKVSIKALNMGDLCFCMYLIIQATVEIKYGSQLVIKENHWQSGISCKLNLVVSLFSLIFTTFLLDYIAMCRVAVVYFPFKEKLKDIDTTSSIVLFSFILVLSFSVMLVFSYFYYEDQIIAPNIMCLMILYEKNKMSPSLIIASLVTILFDTISLIFIPVMYFFLIVEMMKVRNHLKENMKLKDKKDERTFKNICMLLLIVGSNVISWVPIIVFCTMSVIGHSIHPSLISWTTVLVLPINPTLNPFFFTFLSSEFKEFYKSQLQSIKGYVNRHFSRIRIDL